MPGRIVRLREVARCLVEIEVESAFGVADRHADPLRSRRRGQSDSSVATVADEDPGIRDRLALGVEHAARDTEGADGIERVGLGLGGGCCPPGDGGWRGFLFIPARDQRGRSRPRDQTGAQ